MRCARGTHAASYSSEVQRILPVGRVGLSIPRALPDPGEIMGYPTPPFYHHHLLPSRRATFSGASRPRPAGLRDTDRLDRSPQEHFTLSPPSKGTAGSPPHPGALQAGRGGGTPTPSREFPWAEGSPSLLPSLQPGQGQPEQHRGTPASGCRPPAPSALGTSTAGSNIRLRCRRFFPCKDSSPAAGGKVLRIPRSFPSLFPSPTILPAGPFRRRKRERLGIHLAEGEGKLPSSSRGDSLARLRWPGPAGLCRPPITRRRGCPGSPAPGRGDGENRL